MILKASSENRKLIIWSDLCSDSNLISFPKFPSEDITAAVTEPKVSTFRFEIFR